MFVQCPRCQHAFDAAAPNVSCPRCGSPMGASGSGGVVPQTMAMDASMVAQALRASLPSTAPNPFASGAPSATPQAFASPQPFAHPPPSFAPPAYAPQPHYGAQPPVMAQPYGGSYGPPQAYGAQPLHGPSDRDLAGHAVISVVVSALAFLGACNPVGLAGVVLGLMAHNDANNASPNAAARTKTARLVAVAALALTMLGWGAGALLLLLAGNA